MQRKKMLTIEHQLTLSKYRIPLQLLTITCWKQIICGLWSPPTCFRNFHLARLVETPLVVTKQGNPMKSSILGGIFLIGLYSTSDSFPEQLFEQPLKQCCTSFIYNRRLNTIVFHSYIYFLLI